MRDCSQGLSLYGTRVITTVGKDLTHISFFKGFCIELGSTLSVVLASWAGMPVSSTHCQIGSILAVGVADAGLHSVQWSLFGSIAITWLITVPAAAAVAALLLLGLRPLLP